MMKSRIILLPLFFFTCLLSAQLPTDFYDEVVRSDFDFPMGLAFNEEGTMYVWEKAGRVFIVDSTGNRQQAPLIDIREEVMNWKDHGLTGFALDPGFQSNGYFYLLYAVDLHHAKFFGTPNYSADSMTINTATIGRVTRYTADPSTDFKTVLEGSRKVLLGESLTTGIPLLYAFHGLGSLIIGSDGTLLISCGDSTSNGGTDVGGDSLGTFVSPALENGILKPDEDIGSYKSQYLGSFAGKILRIDPETGDGLPSNPFFDATNPRSPQSRTWALGFRNPYRISLKPDSGSHFAEEGNPGIIYVGDVGNGRWEELNIVTEGGQNFGWPIVEGISKNYAFSLVETPENKLAPNPLYGIGNCKEYFNFRDLFTQPKRDEEEVFLNPCNVTEEIPAEAFPMVETLSTIIWNNSKWNPPARAKIPVFNNDGFITGKEITETDSGIEGDHFEGYSSLAGVFYTGNAYPEAYQGTYFAVDFSGWIKTMEFDENDQLQSITPFHDNATNIIHLEYNPYDGLLYFVDLDLRIHKIIYGGNPAPVPVIEADHFFGPGPLTVQFDASASYDIDTTIASYSWDFGDGNTSTAINPIHTFEANGNQISSFTVTLKVSDELGASASTAAIVSLNNSPPDVAISSFDDGDKYPLDRTTLLRLAAEVNDAEHTQEELAYEWRIFFHHNEHFHPEPIERTETSFALLSPLGCAGEDYWYRIELKVTDPAGLSSIDSKQVFPYCGNKFIEFTTLDATVEQGNIHLNWETSIEDGLRHFEIQRSTDFFHFEKIGELSPQGINQTYTFIDEKPIDGNNIYRIKVVQSGQAYDYSNFVTISYPEAIPIRVYPNPSGNTFNIAVEEAKTGIVRLELFTRAGVPVLSTTWESTPGQTFMKKVITSHLINGLYFYRIVNGTEEQAGQLIIAK